MVVIMIAAYRCTIQAIQDIAQFFGPLEHFGPYKGIAPLEQVSQSEEGAQCCHIVGRNCHAYLLSRQRNCPKPFLGNKHYLPISAPRPTLS